MSPNSMLTEATRLHELAVSLERSRIRGSRKAARIVREESQSLQRQAARLYGECALRQVIVRAAQAVRQPELAGV